MKTKQYLRSALALLLAVITLLLSSCGTYSGGTNTGGQNNNGSTGGNNGNLSSSDELEFTVKVLYNGEYLNPEDLAAEGEEINVKAAWSNGFSYHEAELDANGKASVKGLDGEYRVTLTDLPTGFSYNPNIYTANNNRRDLVIEIFDYKTTRGTGANLYEKSIKISKIGLYCAKLDNKDDIVYYEFTPKESGKYAIESWVDVSSNTINPKLDVYYGTSAWKNFAYTLDDGVDEYRQGTFTKNFRYEIEIAPEEVGNAFTFGVRAAVATSAEEAIDITFAITLNGSMGSRSKGSEMIVPYEMLTLLYLEIAELKAMTRDQLAALIEERGYDDRAIDAEYAFLQNSTFPVLQLIINGDGSVTPEYTDTHKLLYDIINGDYITVTFPPVAEGETPPIPYSPVLTAYMNTLYEQGGSYHYAESEMLGAEGRKLFDQNMYRYWSLDEGGDGFYHRYDTTLYPETNGYGPILYADITTGGRFLDVALNGIEYAGNKALTVDYTKNHKHFIEGYRSLITPSGDIGGYYCIYYTGQGGPVICPCVESGCDRACYEGCTECMDDCRAIDPNLDYAPGYADLANRDGRMPVTQELKEFLQSFSVSQRYFADGNGWVEENPNYAVDAPEDSQWLWACGYYE